MLLSYLIIASGWWHIHTLHQGEQRFFYISKMLTMLLIMALALCHQSNDYDGSHIWILLGLGLSLAGDILLMLESRRFFNGVAVLIAAQLSYIIGFAQGPLLLQLVDGLLLLLIGGLVFGRLWGRMGDLQLPAFCLLLGLIIMTWVAAAAWHATLTAAAAAELVGAMLLFFSGSVLALDRFSYPLPLARGWIMSSYFAAQFLIAGSLAS